MKILLLLLFCFNLNATELDDLSHHPVWLRLLHWNGSSSRVDAPQFFLSNEGKTDPKKELEATIKAFKERLTPGDDPWPAACSFVARYDFLKQAGIDLPDYKCDDYNWWRSRLPIKSATMVFSSYYAGNPASIFGHTFLKLNFDANHASKLTDYSVSFAALATDGMGVIYAIKGLLGGYRGYYSMSPYYMKLNEYVHSESRDLWEYPLTLSQKEIDRMLAHIWELMKKGWFSYWFTDENCSFQLLALLDVATGSTSLANDSSFIVLPADTIKTLRRAQRLGEGVIRPSFRKQVIYRHDLLNSDEQDEYEKEIDNKIQSKNPKVLDAVIAKIRFDQLEANNDEELRKNIGKKLVAVLKRRAALGTKTDSFSDSWYESMAKENPLLAHNPSRVQVSGGMREQKGLVRLDARFGLHEPSEREDGLPHHSELTYLSMSLEQYNGKTAIRHLRAVDILSLEPKTPASFPWSWRAFAGATRRLGFPDGLAPQASMLFGKTLAPLKSLSIYGLLGAEVAVHGRMAKSVAVGPATEIGAIATTKFGNFHLQLFGLYDVQQNRPWIKSQLVSRWPITNSFEIGLKGARVFNTPYQSQKNSDEYLAMIARHF